MQFFKSNSNKTGKKNRDLKSAIHQVLTAASDGIQTSAITSVLRSPQPDSNSMLSETLVYQPPTAVTPKPNYGTSSPLVSRTSVSTSIIKPAAAAVFAPAFATVATNAVAPTSFRSSVDPDYYMSSKTLLVMQAKLTPTSEKEKDSKMEAAASYLYGPKVDGGYSSEKKPSASMSDGHPPRTNRAQALRQERNANRINEEKLMREQLRKQRVMRANSDTSGFSSDLSDDEDEGGPETGEPIHARVIPKSLYHKPKITVRDTLSSKFRYLFNRKPAGVNVYFKQADEKDAKKKPPFVLASKQHCF